MGKQMGIPNTPSIETPATVQNKEDHEGTAFSASSSAQFPSMQRQYVQSELGATRRYHFTRIRYVQPNEMIISIKKKLNLRLKMISILESDE